MKDREYLQSTSSYKQESSKYPGYLTKNQLNWPNENIVQYTVVVKQRREDPPLQLTFGIKVDGQVLENIHV